MLGARNNHKMHLIVLSSFLLSACGGGGGDSSTGGGLESGIEKREAQACASSPILDALAKVCNYFATCTVPAQKCERVTQELYVGTTLQSVDNPRATVWNELGGRGGLVSDAGICMLKELSAGPVVTSHEAKLFGLFPAKVTQTLGFLRYDPDAKSMDGYQTVNVCMPLVGCFDARQQSFNATIKRRSPVYPSGTRFGGFPVLDSYAMQISADEKEQLIDITLNDISVSTPIGPVTVKPKLSYSGELKMRQFPAGQKLSRENELYMPVYMEDLYGRTNGVVWSSLWPTAPEWSGWISHVGLGSRQPNDSLPLWASAEEWPERPDYDLGQARNAQESNPVVAFEANAKVNYKPPLPDVLTKAPVNTALDVFVTPTVKARYASQFDIFFNEFATQARDVGLPSRLDLSYVKMMARSEAYASFDVEAGLDLEIIIDTPFGDVPLIKTHPRYKTVLASSPSGPDLPAEQREVGYAASKADPRFWDDPAYPEYALKLSEFRSVASGATNDPKAYVENCVATPVPDQPKPESNFTPATSAILDMTQFACNVCVAHGSFSSGDVIVNAYSTIVHPSSTPSTGPTDWSCNQYHAGCFDLCSRDQTNGALTVTKTAAAMGLHGGTATGEPGYACNYDPIR